MRWAFRSLQVGAATVLIAEPALELHWSTPSCWRNVLLRRLALVMACPALFAGLGSWLLDGLGVWRAPGWWLSGQLTWAVPLVVLGALGAAVATSIGTGRLATGIVAAVWIAQAGLKQYFVAAPWLRPLFLFATVEVGGPPYTNDGHLTTAWKLNRLTLIVIAALLALLAYWRAGHPSERLLTAPDQ